MYTHSKQAINVKQKKTKKNPIQEFIFKDSIHW